MWRPEVGVLSASAALCLVSLRQGLSLDLELSRSADELASELQN